MKDKSEVNNFIGRKTKEDLNYPLTFVLLGILTKNYSKYNCYTNFTHRDIADKVNLSVSTCWNRIKKLEEEKVIKKRVTILNGKKIQLPIVVYVTISVSHQDKKFIDLINDYNEVIEIWRLSGEFDYLLKVVSESLENYDIFIKKLVNEIEYISSFHSNIVLQEIKLGFFEFKLFFTAFDICFSLCPFIS